MKAKKQINPKLMLILSTLLVGLIGLGILGGYTYASFTDKDSQENNFAASGLKGSITEEFTPPGTVEIGKSYSKKVTIKNEEKAPLFVRVLVQPEMTTSDGQVLLASNIGKEIQLDIGSDWLLGEDGFYYYKKVLNANETTQPLFTKVTLANNLDANYQNMKLTISIKSETVSAAGINFRDAYFHGTTPSQSNLKIIDSLYDSISTKTKGGN